jgi:hypothetical protein
MNVQEFIRDTLVQIATAVQETNEKLAEIGIDAAVNPRGANLVSTLSATPKAIPDTQEIRFNIAVSAESETSTQGNAGVGISVLNLGTQGETAKSTSNVSRIEFAVFLRLPMASRG